MTALYLNFYNVSFRFYFITLGQFCELNGKSNCRKNYLTTKLKTEKVFEKRVGKVSRDRNWMFRVFNTAIISLNALRACDSSQSARSRSEDCNHPPGLQDERWGLSYLFDIPRCSSKRRRSAVRDLVATGDCCSCRCS